MLRITCFAIVVITCVCMAVSALAVPIIEFEKTTVSAGDVCPGKSVSGVFAFKNVGDEDLKITGVDKSCDCTLAKPDSSVLKPGESSKIEFSFIAPALGEDISKSISVGTNDPNRTAVRLEIKAKVIPVATLNPERINFGALKAGASIERTVIVTPASADGFKIESVRCAGKCTSVPEFKSMDDGKCSYSLKVVVKAGADLGRVLELVRIKTNMGGAELPLLVFGNVVK